MKSENVMNLVKPGAGAQAGSGVSTKSSKNQKVLAFFSSYMNDYSDNKMGFDNLKQDKSVKVSSSSKEMSSSYEQYQYKSNSISKTDKTPVQIKISDSKKDLDEFEENVVSTISETLEISEEEIVDAMEELGITVYDLLDSQNLAQLVAKLTNVSDPSQMIFVDDFQSLLSDITDMGQNLMKQMNIDPDQLQDIVSEMELLEESVQVEELVADVLPDEEEFLVENGVEVPVSQEENSSVMSDGIEMNRVEDFQGFGEVEADVSSTEEKNKPVDNVVVENDTSDNISQERVVQQENSGSEVVEDIRDSQNVEEDVATALNTKEASVNEQDIQEKSVEDDVVDDTKSISTIDESKDDAQSFENDSEQSDMEEGSFSDSERRMGSVRDNSSHRNRHVMTRESFADSIRYDNIDFEATEVPTTVNSSYVSINTLDMISQLAEQAKVMASQEVSSIEMQLNPENLGKLYLNVTAKEGVVNAQITVTNEAVRQALEAQIATIRENLSQAGVKVDAVEVTVASHEFERNLEQGSSRERQEGEQREQNSSRRSINLSSLDELSGVMTEEETLVAQMMRDNGNSVDFKA